MYQSLGIRAKNVFFKIKNESVRIKILLKKIKFYKTGIQISR